MGKRKRQKDKACLEAKKQHIAIDNEGIDNDMIHRCTIPDQKWVESGHDIICDEELNSTERSHKLFQWLVNPMGCEQFFDEYWQQKPLIICRNSPSIAGGWVTVEDIKEYTGKGLITVNDISYYGEGDSQNRKLVDGPSDVVQRNCSYQVVGIERFNENVAKLLSNLEENFYCKMDSSIHFNTSLEKSFAMYFDYDLFILQLDKSQSVCVYSPVDIYPRSSCTDVGSVSGEPLFSASLSAGDILYVPSGFILKTETGDCSSFSLWISTAHKNSVADMLELVIPQVLEEVISTAPLARRSLDSDYGDFLGARHSDIADDERRSNFLFIWENLLARMKDIAMDLIDPVADQMIRNYISQKVPRTVPVLPQKLVITSKVFMRERDIARVVIEEDKAMLYHCIKSDAVYLEYAIEDVMLLEAITDLSSSDKAVMICDLPESEKFDDTIGDPDILLKQTEYKLRLCQDLYNIGIICTL